MILHSEQLRHGLNWNALFDQVADVSLSKPAQAHCGRQPDHASTRSENAGQRFQNVCRADQLGNIGMTRSAMISGHALHHGRRERHSSRSMSPDVEVPAPADLHNILPAYSSEFGFVDPGAVDQRENGVVSDCYGVCRGERRESQTLFWRRVESDIHAFGTRSRARRAATLRKGAIKARQAAIRKLKDVKRRDSIDTSKPKILTTPCRARAKRGALEQKSTAKTRSCAKPLTKPHLKSEGQISMI